MASLQISEISCGDVIKRSVFNDYLRLEFYVFVAPATSDRIWDPCKVPELKRPLLHSHAL